MSARAALNVALNSCEGIPILCNRGYWVREQKCRAKTNERGGRNQIGLKSSRAVPEPAQLKDESQIRLVGYIAHLLETARSVR
jgi:hypothetical protein